MLRPKRNDVKLTDFGAPFEDSILATDKCKSAVQLAGIWDTATPGSYRLLPTGGQFCTGSYQCGTGPLRGPK